MMAGGRELSNAARVVVDGWAMIGRKEDYVYGVG